MIARQKSEIVDALQLKGHVQYMPIEGGDRQFGKPGDYLVHRADGAMQIMPKAEFEERFGKCRDMTAEDTAERQASRGKSK